MPFVFYPNPVISISKVDYRNMALSRLDDWLVARGFFLSIDDARRHIMAGTVLVDDRVVNHPGTLCDTSKSLRVRKKSSSFVSRGGDKLHHFLSQIPLAVSGMWALDIGISTGGFTDALLHHGAVHVVGVDVGYGIVDYRLRTDDRVSLLERTNARRLTPDDINRVLVTHDRTVKDIQLVVMDVSFISVFKLLPTLRNILSPMVAYIVLIKPQFEAMRGMLKSGGVMVDTNDINHVIHHVESQLVTHNFTILHKAPSALKGAKGNQEYFYYLSGCEG